MGGCQGISQYFNTIRDIVSIVDHRSVSRKIGFSATLITLLRYKIFYISRVHTLLGRKPNLQHRIQLDIQHGQQHHRLQLHSIGRSFHLRLLAISVLNSLYNLLRPMTDFSANNTCLKTPRLTTLCSTTLSFTSSSTIIPSTKYTIVSSLEEKRARKQDQRA